MDAGQQISNALDGAWRLEDLGAEDNLVLTSLDVLEHARPDAWDQIMALHRRGGFLVVLDQSFVSRGEFGDVMMAMMDRLYRLGLSRSGP